MKAPHPSLSPLLTNTSNIVQGTKWTTSDYAYPLIFRHRHKRKAKFLDNLLQPKSVFMINGNV